MLRYRVGGHCYDRVPLRREESLLAQSVLLRGQGRVLLQDPDELLERCGGRVLRKVSEECASCRACFVY